MADLENKVRLHPSTYSLVYEESVKDSEETGDLKVSIGFIGERITITTADYQTKFKDSIPLYKIIRERAEILGDAQLSENDVNSLDIDAKYSLGFAFRNLEAKRYKDALICGQRALNNYELIKQYLPGSEDILNDVTQLAHDFIERSKVMWQNPETGALRIEMERYAKKGKYEKAAEIRDEIANRCENG